MHVSSALLNKETDARFWAQTGYKVGQKLNPKDKNDRAMTKVWLDIFAKVKAEDDAGTLHVSFNDTNVSDRIDHAKASSDAAKAHIDAAASAPDPETAAAHVVEATKANNAATRALREAAKHQPPTVSPEVVHAAATQVAEDAGRPPPPPLPSKPALATSAARPAIPSDVVLRPLPHHVPTPHAPAHAPYHARPIIVTQTPSPLSIYEAMPGAPLATMPPALSTPPTASPLPPQGPLPATASPPFAPPIAGASPTVNAMASTTDHPDPAPDPLSQNHAINAPAIAAQVHEDAHDDAQRGLRLTGGTTPPSLISTMRRSAQDAAKATDAPAVGVSLAITPQGNQWTASKFDTGEDAYVWFHQYTADPSRFLYAAVFSRSDSHWPGAVEETLGKAILPTKKSTGISTGVAVAVGGAAVVGLLALAFSSKKSTAPRGYYGGPIGVGGERVTITKRKL